MTALQKIAMGLVILVVEARFGGWDGVADPAGWVLILLGLRGLATPPAVRTAAWVSLAASIIVYPPDVVDRLDDATQWWLSQPQVVFLVLLCYAVPALVGGARQRSFRTVASLVVLADIGILAVLGAGLDALGEAVILLTRIAEIWLIWLLFSISRRGENSQVTSSRDDR